MEVYRLNCTPLPQHTVRDRGERLREAGGGTNGRKLSFRPVRTDYTTFTAGLEKQGK